MNRIWDYASRERYAMKDLLALIFRAAGHHVAVRVERRWTALRSSGTNLKPYAARVELGRTEYLITTDLFVRTVEGSVLIVDDRAKLMRALLLLTESHMALEASERIKDGNNRTLTAERDEARDLARRWYASFVRLEEYTRKLLGDANRAGIYCYLHGADYFQGARKALDDLPEWIRGRLLK